MNGRIDELAKQAKKYAFDAMIKITDKEQALKVYSETYDTKFAESLIEECIQVLKDTGYPNAHGNCVGVEELKQHFGIK